MNLLFNQVSHSAAGCLNNLTNFSNGIRTNKFIQNPISFKGSIQNDTFVHSAKQNTEIEQEKQRVNKKVQGKIEEYIQEINEINNSIKVIEQEKQSAFRLAKDEELSFKTGNLVLNYLDTQKFKKLITNELLNENINSEKIKNILIEHDDTYKRKFEKQPPSDEKLITTAYGIAKSNSDNKFKKKCKALIQEYCKDNFIDINEAVIDIYSDCLFNTIAMSYDDFENILSIQFDKKIKSKEEEKETLKNEISILNKDLNHYYSCLEENIHTAPYYEPLTTYEETYQKLINSGQFTRLSKDDYSAEVLAKLKKLNLLKYFKYTNLLYIQDEVNKKTLSILKGKEGKLKTQKEILHQYHITSDDFNKLFLPVIEFEGENNEKFVLYDLSGDEAIETIKNAVEKAEKLKVEKSEYAYGDFYAFPEKKEIPAAILKKLGYGDIKTIRDMIRSGYLAGSIKKIESAEGIKCQTMVNLHDKKTPNILQELRKNTPVLTLEEFAKKTGRTQKKITELIKDGEIDIIPEYIFSYESHKKYIDTRTEKNSSFIEKALFENELTQEIKRQTLAKQKEEAKQRKIKRKSEQSRYQSMKMSLVWHFCPETRNLASFMALQDGHLCALLVKDSEEEEDLTQKEEIKVNSYRKQLWQAAGTDELKEGYKKAGKILEQYHLAGLDGIDDDEARKIIELYENN